MVSFSYKALKENGKMVSGSIKAENQKLALLDLEERGLFPYEIKIEKDNTNKGIFKISIFKRDELIQFTRQLANLLLAGIKLGESLEIIGRLLQPGKFKEVVISVYESLKGGRDFADCLGDFPEYFPPSYISMIKAGQEGGFLDLTCERLADNLEESRKLKSFIITSLIYPVILFLVSIIAIIIMIVYVLPKFMLIYDNYGTSLPLITQSLLIISSFISNYGIHILVTLIAFMFILWWYFMSGDKRREFVIKITFNW